MSKSIPGTITPVAAIAILLTVADPSVASGEHGGGHDDGGGPSVPFGEPAPADEADRTIRITANDQMQFEPEGVRVQAGQTVRFVVENVGKVQHSFTLGTPRSQEQHEAEMRGMAPDRIAGHMEENPMGMVVQPGETGTLTWRFEDAGPVEFACHIPGHFVAGMTGRIRVN